MPRATRSSARKRATTGQSRRAIRPTATRCSPAIRISISRFLPSGTKSTWWFRASSAIILVAPIALFSGRVVKVAASGVEPVATELMFPTGMTAGLDGNLDVSNFGSWGT